CQLVRPGQLAVPEQEGDFLEGGMSGDLLDVIAADDELAARSVHVAQLGPRDDEALEAARGGVLHRFDAHGAPPTPLLHEPIADPRVPADTLPDTRHARGRPPSASRLLRPSYRGPGNLSTL